MKKYYLITILVFAFIAAAAPYSYSDGVAGKILTVKKDVYLVQGDRRTDAVSQVKLFSGDAVETGSRSRTKILFTDDSLLNLGESSRVEVDEYLYNSETERSKSIYKLIDGSMKVVVGRSDLEIHTSTAVAAARGTSFNILSEGQGNSLKTCSKVFSGEVIFNNKNKNVVGSLTAKAGDTCCIPMMQPPMLVLPPKPLTPPVTPPGSRSKTVLQPFGIKLIINDQ